VNHEINNPLAFLVLTQATIEEELSDLIAQAACADSAEVAAGLTRVRELAGQMSEGLARVTTIKRKERFLRSGTRVARITRRNFGGS
jgi:hypothetical protein